MSRGAWLATVAGLSFVAAGTFVAAGATSEPDPRPTPPRVYSSCLAADTQPIPADEDPCDSR
ncbi:hypothetical protein ACWGH5_14865 [Streptomyces sp. NPDC054864]